MIHALHNTGQSKLKYSFCQSAILIIGNIDSFLIENLPGNQMSSNSVLLYSYV